VRALAGELPSTDSDKSTCRKQNNVVVKKVRQAEVVEHVGDTSIAD
jgi:hypothetical protein